MHGVSQHANNFRRQYGLENFDGFLDVALVRECHAAACDIFARALAQRFHVRQKWLGLCFLGVHGVLLLKISGTGAIFIHRIAMQPP
jgi:hypothetical protein